MQHATSGSNNNCMRCSDSDSVKRHRHLHPELARPQLAEICAQIQRHTSRAPVAVAVPVAVPVAVLLPVAVAVAAPTWLRLLMNARCPDGHSLWQLWQLWLPWLLCSWRLGVMPKRILFLLLLLLLLRLKLHVLYAHGMQSRAAAALLLCRSAATCVLHEF